MESLTLEAMIAAEIVKARLKGEDFYFTMTCEMGGNGSPMPRCGQQFKIVRGCGGIVMCPKCGMTHDCSKSPLREAVMGIPVD